MKTRKNFFAAVLVVLAAVTCSKKVFAAVLVALASLIMCSCTYDDLSDVARTKSTDKNSEWQWIQSTATQTVDDQTQNYSVSGETLTITKSDGEVTGISRDTIATNAKLPRTVVCESNWSAEQNTAQQTTSVEKTETISLQDSTWRDGDFYWSATKWTKKITTVVTLADGSKETNLWRATEWTKVKVAYGNQTFEFKNFDVATSNTAAVKQLGEKNYAYGDTLSYRLGENILKVVAPGTINIVKNDDPIVPEEDPFFPKEWGKVEEVRQLHSLDADGNGGIDTWCMYFSNGYVLPVPVRNDAPQYDFKLVEKTSDKSYNGAAFNQSLAAPKWVPVYGKREGSCITYSRGSNVVEKVGYTRAMSLKRGWNNEGNHAFVCEISPRYTFHMENGVFTAYHNGKKMGSWTYSTK
jgi:Tfp pilus assembly protein PilV